MPGNNSVNAMTSHSLPSTFGDEWPQEPVDLLSRNPLLPKFYQYDHHPLWPYGKAYVYEADTLRKAQQALLDHTKVRKIVRRFKDNLKQQGELQLLPYEAVFSGKTGQDRISPNGNIDNQDPHDNVIQLWVADGRLYDSISSTFRDEVTQLRDDVLGPESLSMEKLRAVSSVNANSKLLDDKDCQLQNCMLKTYAAIGVAAMKLAPESVQCAARLKAELVNSPLIAQDNNYYHRESQINMSQAQNV
ncbi:hypothetical protein K439DRAFT_1613242 [Ramaria rubella]|nr:hypothetical protein K439DRAFT_1613242 [Ramaria rubella]